MAATHSHHFAIQTETHTADGVVIGHHNFDTSEKAPTEVEVFEAARLIKANAIDTNPDQAVVVKVLSVVTLTSENNIGNMTITQKTTQTAAFPV